MIWRETEPVPVYELIGHRSDTPLVQRYQSILEPYHRAMVLYESRRFEEAAELFRVAMHAGEGIDAPSALYVQRCEELAASPPPTEWDGVFVQKHK